MKIEISRWHNGGSNIYQLLAFTSPHRGPRNTALPSSTLVEPERATRPMAGCLGLRTPPKRAKRILFQASIFSLKAILLQASPMCIIKGPGTVDEQCDEQPLILLHAVWEGYSLRLAHGLVICATRHLEPGGLDIEG
jgi:hypothetical protein